VLIALLAVVVTIAAEPPSCVAKAEQLVAKVEKLMMARRLAVIDLAMRRDPSIVCHVVDGAFFQNKIVPPPGCTEKRCEVPGGLELDPKLLEDAGFDLYLRVQTLAAKLRAAKKLSAAHARLLSTMLLSAALKEPH
jgi:hypothetical protein